MLRLGSFLFSVYAWTIWLAFLVVFGPVAIVSAAFFPRIATYHLVRSLLYLMFGLTGIRVRKVVSPRIERGRPAVYMGNHINLLDPFTFFMTMPVTDLVGLEKAENHRIPIYGWLARRWGNVPVVRSDPEQARKSVEALADRFRKGQSVGILPEGTRSKDGRLLPFKKGGFHLAVATGATIVPFVFEGTLQVFRTGDWHIHPGTITVTYLDPIPAEGLGAQDVDALSARVRGAIAHHLGQVDGVPAGS